MYKKDRFYSVNYLLGWIGLLWSIGGIIIIALSNWILITKENMHFWILPVNVRDPMLVAFILFPGAILLLVRYVVLKFFLKKTP